MAIDDAGNFFEHVPDFPSGRPALFLDRDGVIIKERHYIRYPDDVSLIEGATAAVREHRRAGYAVVIVSNQSGIGRGLLAWSDFHAVQDRLRGLWQREGAAWDMALACPHHPTHGRGLFARDSPWRKPRPGMFLFAATTLNLDLGRSIAVGDKVSDLMAGAAAGVGSLVHVATGHGSSEIEALDRSPLSASVTRLPSLARLTVDLAALRDAP